MNSNNSPINSDKSDEKKYDQMILNASRDSS